VAVAAAYAEHRPDYPADAAMLAELRQRVPSARALAGPAEAIPLPDGSVDAVLCGQSMHWFDMSRAVPVLIMAPAERDRLLGQVRGYLASRPETAGGAFELPMVTAVVRSVRR